MRIALIVCLMAGCGDSDGEAKSKPDALVIPCPVKQLPSGEWCKPLASYPTVTVAATTGPKYENVMPIGQCIADDCEGCNPPIYNGTVKYAGNCPLACPCYSGKLSSACGPDSVLLSIQKAKGSEFRIAKVYCEDPQW